MRIGPRRDDAGLGRGGWLDRGVGPGQRPGTPDAAGGALRRAVALAFSPDGRLLAAGRAGGPVALYDLEARRARALIDPAAATAGAECLAFAPDGGTLAVGQQDGRITLWDVATRRVQSSLPGHAEVVYSLAYSPDGGILASSGGDRTVRLWDPATGRQRRAIAGQPGMLVALAFSPDSRILALADRQEPRRPAVGPRRRGGAPGPARRGGRRARRGDQPRRPHPRRRRLPRRGPLLGARHRPARPAEAGAPAASRPWPSRRTAAPWPPAASTAPSISGIGPSRLMRTSEAPAGQGGSVDETGSEARPGVNAGPGREEAR